jgi:NAD+ diphosphatase
MSLLDPLVLGELEALAARYGAPRRVEASLTGRPFDPLTRNDRYGEVCMVVRRPDGRLLTAIKTFYPAGAFRLLTGGVNYGESIEAALLRETREETGLQVSVRRFLALAEYRITASGEPPADPAGEPDFVSFAFLLDEVGGTLGVEDEDEEIAEFRAVTVAELPVLADRLSGLPDLDSDRIGGNWRDWGRFRAVVHRAVYEALSGDER